MKYCVTCQKPNGKGIIFIGGQCKSCFETTPIIDVVYVRPEKICEICGKPMKSVCIPCKRSKEAVEKILNPKVVIKKANVVKNTCSLCNKEETDKNPFKPRNKGDKYVHISCIEYKKAIKTLEHKRNKEERVNKTLLEKISSIPEYKICENCDNNKHISEYYIYNFIPYNVCKNCHHDRCKIWRLNHIEKVRKYLKEYHKTYKRKKK